MMLAACWDGLRARVEVSCGEMVVVVGDVRGECALVAFSFVLDVALLAVAALVVGLREGEEFESAVYAEGFC